MELADRLIAGDQRALARAISMVEDGDPAIPELLREAVSVGASAHVVGVTGPPGAGKSSLCDGLIERWRAQGDAVGVLAVDPSSPFSGGALLGDRVRMQRHATDPGVFIRSMAARGHLGGLAGATWEAIRLVEASGRRRCLVETVGVGQSEIDVMRAADTTVVVITPSSGDGVQVIKAGLLEIADIYVVNKADGPGADHIVKELRRLVHETKSGTIWEPPVLATVATRGEGLAELDAEISRHHRRLVQTGELQRRRHRRLLAKVEDIVAARAVARARAAFAAGTLVGRLGDDPLVADPYALADDILDNDVDMDKAHRERVSAVAGETAGPARVEGD